MNAATRRRLALLTLQLGHLLRRRPDVADVRPSVAAILVEHATWAA